MAAVTHVGKIYPHKPADERRIVTSAYGGDYSATLIRHLLRNILQAVHDQVKGNP